ncbi:MAG: stage II sporulation protein P [Bacillota bacterium]|jgi:stage II sporulation protein P
MKKGFTAAGLILLGLFAAHRLGADPDIRAKLENLENLTVGRLFVQEGADTAPDEGDMAVISDGETGMFAPEGTIPPFPSELEVPETPTPEPEATPVVLPTTIEGGMVITNNTSYELDLGALVSAGTSVKLAAEGPQVLIIHTHGSEAYTPTMTDTHKRTDNYRTEDRAFSVVRVGDELTACLESFGLEVIHDREIYDYPSYTGSYARSDAAVRKYLAEYPSISVVLDVHRDAIGSGDVVYKTMAEDGGKPCSQVMLLVGTGENGLEHPNWKENLKFALSLQSAVVEKYPTLSRPIALKKERYNQQLSTGYLIVEVGSSGNTLDEALNAVRLFADAAGPMLKGLQ